MPSIKSRRKAGTGSRFTHAKQVIASHRKRASRSITAAALRLPKLYPGVGGTSRCSPRRACSYAVNVACTFSREIRARSRWQAAGQCLSVRRLRFAFSHSSPLVFSPLLSFFGFCLRHIAKALASGDLVLPSDPFVSRMSLGWIQTMCLWNELVQAGVVNTTASLRMNDFTRKVRTVSTTSDGWSIAHSLRAPQPSFLSSFPFMCSRVRVFLRPARSPVLKPSNTEDTLR